MGNGNAVVYETVLAPQVLPEYPSSFKNSKEEDSIKWKICLESE